MGFNFFILFYGITLQLFDISTTVDPSYIISLIRKLLPPNGSNLRNSYGNGDDDGDASVTKMDESDAGDEVLSSSGTVSKSQDIEVADGSNKLADEDACPRLEQHISSSEEKVWEEYGCILWDLSANKSHAELMVLEIPSRPHPHTLFCPLD